MISDSIPKASIPMVSANPKDLAKKKRSHRSAKLKQYKLDARREQWLSQVKNKGPKVEQVCLGGSCGSVKDVNERGRSIEKLKINPMVGEDNEGSLQNYSDLDSPANSPTNHSSTDLGGNDSSTNFSGSSSGSSSSSSRTSCSGLCWSTNMSEEEEEEGDDGCLDDWEAIADALDDMDGKHEKEQDSHHGRNEKVVQSSPQSELSVAVDNSKLAPKPPANCRAWRPDDAFRPQSLPILSKQYSFPMNSERYYHGGSTVWGCRNLSAPTSCPICCEDLDFTDTSFLPCPCGFRLCLFCHKRILEEDGRCPGCRKPYDHDHPDEGETIVDGSSVAAFRLARSCSMISRS